MVMPAVSQNTKNTDVIGNLKYFIETQLDIQVGDP